MTARADSLTRRAKTADRSGSVRFSHPASSARVFVDALERLEYRMDPLLTEAGIRRADLDDPDVRIPIAVLGPAVSPSARGASAEEYGHAPRDSDTHGRLSAD
jgi:hypothetical protein